MKTIGQTENGNSIVEMTKNEHHALAVLQMAVEGKNDCVFMDSRHNLIVDLETALGCVFAYAATLRCAKELKHMVDTVVKSLETRQQIPSTDPSQGCKTCGKYGRYVRMVIKDEKQEAEFWCENHVPSSLL